nr:MAG TPA: hypothetical protein [Caudoviricetes sp.]
MTREPALSVSCADSSPRGGAKGRGTAGRWGQRPLQKTCRGGCPHPPGVLGR